jgi:hypothetical protein
LRPLVLPFISLAVFSGFTLQMAFLITSGSYVAFGRLPSFTYPVYQQVWGFFLALRPYFAWHLSRSDFWWDNELSLFWALFIASTFLSCLLFSRRKLFSALFTLAATSLMLFTLTVYVYIWDSGDFGNHVVGFFDGTPLVWVSNEVVLFVSSAVFVLCVVYMRRLKDHFDPKLAKYPVPPVERR